MSAITFTLIQSNLHWENRPANRSMFEEKIKNIREHTEIVVLPEMFSTGFSMNPAALAEDMNGETVQWMKRMAASQRIILAGSLIISDNGHYYNRFIWALPDGSTGFTINATALLLPAKTVNIRPATNA